MMDTQESRTTGYADDLEAAAAVKKNKKRMIQVHTAGGGSAARTKGWAWGMHMARPRPLRHIILPPRRPARTLPCVSTSGGGTSVKTAVAAQSAITSERDAPKTVERSKIWQLKGKRERKGEGNESSQVGWFRRRHPPSVLSAGVSRSALYIPPCRKPTNRVSKETF